MEKTKPKTNKKNLKNSFRTTEVVFLILITCVVSVIMGWTLGYRSSYKMTKQEDKNLQNFIDTYNKVVEDYYDDVNKEELINNAIDGMLSNLEDGYSMFIDELSKNTFDARLEGTYSGLGIEIYNNLNKDIIVSQVFKGSSADEEGIETGDIVVGIDKKDLKGESTTTLISYIKENDKKEYELTIKRNDETITKKLTKKTINIKSVDSKLYEKNNKKIGYINIDIFSKNAPKQFKEELKSLEDKKIDSLIIDVRGNSGGYLTSATNILSQLLDSKNIIYKTDKKGKIEKFYSTGKETKKYPIVVLQNEASASASELLSSSLQEQYKATVVGTKSYGKGTVQEVVSMKNGSEYKYTSKKWLTPSGKWINKVGVKPDVEVEMSEDYKNEPKEENDNQLQKALSILAD